MKLSEHIEACRKVLEAHGDLGCFSAIDDEGNGYNEVVYSPTVGHMTDDKWDKTFYDEDYMEDGQEINAVVIN